MNRPSNEKVVEQEVGTGERWCQVHTFALIMAPYHENGRLFRYTLVLLLRLSLTQRPLQHTTKALK